MIADTVAEYALKMLPWFTLLTLFAWLTDQL